MPKLSIVCQILFLLLGLSSHSYAQHLLKFRVLEKGTGTPIRKVEIRIGSDKVFTDADGNALVNLQTNSLEVSFIKTGFQTSSLPMSDISTATELEVLLYPALGTDDEVIIRGKRRPSISKKVISSNEAQRVAPGGDPGQVTKLLPGVTTQPGQSEVTVRGSKPSDSAYYLDDIKVPFIYHTIGNLSVLPASVIDDVEFSAGGFGTEYGDATGGVVVLKSKNEIPEKSKTKVTLNLPFYSALYHESPIDETSGYLIGVRKSYLEYILPKAVPKDSGVSITPYFRDYQGIYTKKLDDGHYKLSLLASADGLKATAPGNLSNDESGAGRFFIQTYFGAIALERQKKLSGGWTLTSTPQTVYTDNKFEVSDLKFRIQAQNFRLPMEFVKRITPDERLYLGFETSYVPFIVTYYLPKFDADDPFYDVEEAPRVQGKEKGTSINISTWVARDIKLPNGGILTSGVRAFYFNLINRSSADPRFQYRQSVSASQTIKAAIGQYSQNPRNGEPAKKFGNPKLTFPRAMHYILGIESKWDDRWDSELQVFYKDVRMVVRSDPNINYNNKGRLQSYGIETFIRRSLTEKWFGWLSYTYSRTREQKDEESSWYPGENDQTHVLNIAGSYRKTATWDIGGRLGFHTGDTYTSKKGEAVYNANLDKYQSRAENGINASRLPNYNELSMFSGHDILFDYWKANLRYGIEYLWFTRQAYGVNSNYDYSKETYFKGVPPIPFLELRGEF